MTTARTELPYPCSPQAMTRDETIMWRDSLPWKNTLVQRISGILSACNIEYNYSAVNHPWWMSMLFHRRGLLWLWLGCSLHLVAAVG